MSAIIGGACILAGLIPLAVRLVLPGFPLFLPAIGAVLLAGGLLIIAFT